MYQCYLFFFENLFKSFLIEDVQGRQNNNNARLIKEVNGNDLKDRK
jgi:hypothetical protein